ncbi:MAG: helix-turn-helix domain-containing protein [Patescibacteria group bacterium]|nr:hypothetical protein [Patescibacteria group bacterium]
MELEILPLELRKLGLTEKQASVYLTALELGYTSIQKIAQKAKISRPTTYEIVKTLKQKRLISESRDKNKTYFIAESPDKLLGILKIEKKEIKEKEREFLRIISALKSKYFLGDKREIKTYNGKAEIENLLNDFLNTQSKKIYILIGNEKIWPLKNRKSAYQKITKRLGKVEILEKKSIKNEIQLFSGVVIIYDKIIILPDKKSTGILVENKILINLIKSFFLHIWK